MDNNKFSLYRRIRYDRTYRTLGKMSWWRVTLGTLLLLSILFFTGIVSRPFEARGEFRTAKALLITPAWLAHYHPEDLAYIEAGILYQDGDYEAALEAFRGLDTDAAGAMRSRSALKLADLRLAEGDEAGAAALLDEVDASVLTEAEAQSYAALQTALGAPAA